MTFRSGEYISADTCYARNIFEAGWLAAFQERPESSKAKEGPYTIRCDICGELMQFGPCDATTIHVKPCKHSELEPTGQAQEAICPRCESRYRNFKTLHCIADPHKWHSEEGRQWPREAQEAPKDITEDLYNCNTDVKE